MAALLAPALAGCSLIYNPNNLPAPIDAAPLDSDPTMLQILKVAPQVIDEGQGDGGSLPALIVIQGHQIVNANLKVQLVAPKGVTVRLEPVIDAVAAHDGDRLAFTVIAHVDPSLETSVPLDVTVTQDIPTQYGGGVATVTRPAALTLRGLPELTSTRPEIDRAKKTATLPLQAKYSSVDLTDIDPLTFTGPSGVRAEISAVSSIKLGALEVSAKAAIAGPGGFTTAGPGAGGGGMAALVLGYGGGGGGAGFAVAGTKGTDGASGGGSGGNPNGEDLVLAYDANRASAGGNGGNGLAAVGSLAGGAGGAGGGIVVLNAGGDIMAGTISATGGNGAVPPGGSALASGGGGGGGAGGTVAVRSGNGALSCGTIHVAGGLGGKTVSNTGVGNGGAGSVGRARWDAPAGSAPVSPDRVAHRGPTFTGPKQLVTTSDQSFMLTGTPGDEIDVVVTDEGNTPHAGDHAAFNSAGIAVITPTLYSGYDRLCVKLSSGLLTESAANACIDVAYVP